MSCQQILDSIPHRSPMLLLDDVGREMDHIVCMKTFIGDEFFFQALPDYPLVPGVIQ
jgi:3-hydroxymyristoyl/3-hydroxydecanoyl-(acyl carrier protein) dehydratase